MNADYPAMVGEMISHPNARRAPRLFAMYRLTEDTWMLYRGYRDDRPHPYPKFLTCGCGGATLGAAFFVNFPRQVTGLGEEHFPPHMVYHGGANCDCPSLAGRKWWGS